jgi:hypothetical protein
MAEGCRHHQEDRSRFEAEAVHVFTICDCHVTRFRENTDTAQSAVGQTSEEQSII